MHPVFKNAPASYPVLVELCLQRPSAIEKFTLFFSRSFLVQPTPSSVSLATLRSQHTAHDGYGPFRLDRSATAATAAATATATAAKASTLLLHPVQPAGQIQKQPARLELPRRRWLRNDLHHRATIVVVVVGPSPQGTVH